MKNFKSIFAFSFLVLGLTILNFSCKKDKPEVLKDWYTGTYYTTSTQTTSGISFSCKADGTLLAYIATNGAFNFNSASGTGTYTLQNGLFTASVIYTAQAGITYVYQATYNSTNRQFTSGTWGHSPSKTDGGTWSMNVIAD